MQPTSEIDTVFRVLADPTRRKVLERVVNDGEVTVSQLVGGSEVTQPNISHHLKVLKEAGLVSDRREGKQIYYTAVQTGFGPLIDWMDVYASFWRERFAALRSVLREIDP